MNVNKIYVVHYKPFIDRLKYIKNFFTTNNITNYEIRDKYDKEDLTEEMKNFYWQKEKEEMNPAQICIAIQHIEIYRDIAKQKNDGWYLILEDDAIFCDDFINRLNEYLAYAPIDADYLDINDYLIRHYFPNPQGKWTKFPNSRTLIGYLVKKQTCEKLLQTIIPINTQIDHALNIQIKIHNLNVYHADQPLIFTGHHYVSSYTL